MGIIQFPRTPALNRPVTPPHELSRSVRQRAAWNSFNRLRLAAEDDMTPAIAVALDGATQRMIEAMADDT